MYISIRVPTECIRLSTPKLGFWHYKQLPQTPLPIIA
jgi:hypothetical protein